MDGNNYIWLAPLIAFLVPAIGWGFREYWQHRNAKRQAAGDSSKTLSDKKKLLEELLSKTENINDKNNLAAQLDEVNAALLGLHAQRLRQTLKDAGLPTEDELVESGLTQLKPEQATRLNKVIEEIEPPPPPPIPVRDFWVMLGDSYYLLKRYEEAKDIYDKIINLNPYDQIAIRHRGAAYVHMQKYEDAIIDFNRSLELKADEYIALHDRGVAFKNLKKYKEALDDFNRALELKPEHPYILYNLACLFSLRGETNNALAYLEKAIEKRKKYREMAKTKKDFDNIRKDPRFKKLIGED